MSAAEAVVTLAPGAAYGFVSVLVGQPLDTIKTTMQARTGQTSMIKTGREIFAANGIRGLYRGGIPPFLGGAIFRSCQFSFYNTALQLLRSSDLPQVKYGPFDYQVILAGMAGGFGRGIAEGPFDYVKVRQQVGGHWSLREVYKGTGITMTRNIGLFAYFAFYIDLSKYCTNGEGLSPFWTGALCANAAWLCIWPLDVVKSRTQSGLFEGYTFRQHIREAARSGVLFRGLLAGLGRSTLANGSAMVAYKYSQTKLEEWMGLNNKGGSAI